MKIYYELNLKSFDAWSGAKETLATLTIKQIEQLENMLPDIFEDEASETQLNDFLWFETDTIAEMLGFRNWEHLERTNNGEYEPIKIQCYNIDWDIDDEDVEIYLPKAVLFKLEDDDDIEAYYESKENGDEDDFLSDKLSDEYGFCVNSFEYKEVI